MFNSRLAGVPNPLLNALVTGYEYQEFHDGTESFEVRIFPGTEMTQGKPFVTWEDIQSVFPEVVRLQCDKRIIGFMADSDGNRLQPLRIECQPDVLIRVINNRASSLFTARKLTSLLPPPISIPPPLPTPARILQTPSPSSSTLECLAYFTLPIYSRYHQQQQPPLSGDNLPDSPTLESKSTQQYLIHRQDITPSLQKQQQHQQQQQQQPRQRHQLSDDFMRRFRSSIILYESLLQYIQDDQIGQTKPIQNDFREHFSKQEARLSRSKDRQHEVLVMQQAILEKQHTVAEIQKQALDRLAVIQNRVQVVLAQNFELLDYPMMPRLFVVLPKDIQKCKTAFPGEHEFRLYFLCECGEHTKQASVYSKIPHHIHLAKHEGYALERSTEFFRRYGAYVLNLLQMLKYGVAVAGCVVPALTNPWTGGGEEEEGQEATVAAASRPRSRSKSLSLSYPHYLDINAGVDQAIEFLKNLIKDGKHGGWTGELEHLESTDLRQLGAFLKTKDASRVLGNLYRVVTNEGHVKWVCEDHHRDAYGVTAVRELSEVITITRGYFAENLGRVEATLTNTVLASHFYKVVQRGRFIHQFKITLKWGVTMNDLRLLRDTIQKSNIICFDLACTPVTVRSDILSRGKRSGPLWEIMMISRVRSFILSGFMGFFSRSWVPARMNNLRVLKITERFDWKRDGSTVSELLEKTLRLKELHLSCTNVAEAYGTIRKIGYRFNTLERLDLDGGDLDRVQVLFHEGTPVSMDLLVSDLCSSLLKEAKILRTLHLRSGPRSPFEIDVRLLNAIIARNPDLERLVIQCEAKIFLRLHLVVKAALAENESSVLMKLDLYGGGNKLLIGNLLDDRSVELELMSSTARRDVIETLFKDYGMRMTRFRVERGDVLRSFVDIVVQQVNEDKLNSTMMLRHLDIKSSCVMESMLKSLRLILKCSATTLTQLTILLEKSWDATSTEISNTTTSISPFLADFVVELGSRWTKITIREEVTDSWKAALGQRGYIVPEQILVIVPRGFDPDSFSRHHTTSSNLMRGGRHY
ncbi:hypothetical protein BGZ98_009268 [Dissophora globulifera]|nr:hypothetical protein BGZ98_009268 [Dissophora globulifera]